VTLRRGAQRDGRGHEGAAYAALACDHLERSIEALTHLRLEHQRPGER
jgi:hypothetical protein